MLTKTRVKEEKCVSGNFKRMNYFNGMLLTEQDFQDEQTYVREKLKLHNRLHGSGVIWGLCLRKGCVKVGEIEVTKIFIDAGLALDCAGNEIILCEDFLAPLDEKIEELRKFGLLRRIEECDPPKYEGPRLYIGIKYCECQSQPREQLTSECADDSLRPLFSRVREGFSVKIFTEEEYHRCTERKGSGNGKAVDCGCRGVPPCSEEEMTVFLGYVEEYDTSGVDHPDHKDAKITQLDNTLSTVAQIQALLRPAKNWERHRQAMLSTVFRKEDIWVDVSVLIGKSVTSFPTIIENLGLQAGNIYVPSELDEGNLESIYEEAKTAMPWAKKESELTPADFVDIITDSDGKCIIFPLVRKAQTRR